MQAADLAIIVLIGLFLCALMPRAHLGLAAFAAAFLVGTITDVPTKELVSFFPSGFFILIVGVMMLFAVVQATGAMQWILSSVLELVRGRIALIPLVPFVLGALITAMGTLPAAAIAIMAPIGMGLSRQYRIPPFLMAFAILNGIGSGLFSPVAVFGLTTSELLTKLNITVPANTSVLMMLGSLGVGVATTTVMMLIYRKRLRIAAAEYATLGPVGAAGPTVAGLQKIDEEQPYASRRARTAALVGLLVLVVAGLVFDLDLGFTGFTIAFVLIIALRLDPPQIFAQVPWGVVILIGGLMTYLGLMEKLGAFKRLSQLLSVGESPVLGLLVICYIAAITSFLANSIAVIVSSLPLLPPLVAAGINPVGAVLAVVMSAILVDVNPLGVSGGLILGSTEPADRQKLFRGLLAYGLAAVIVAPPLVWALFGLW
ncbi:SLC13 family permease [Nocardia fluminea]|uniref:SLC13 family permease n=1 Tax=Nocardia fluminea TaxID=134984 RepID=UPI003673078D